MTDNIDTIRIQLDYLQGPIWPSDFETGEPLTGNDTVDSDERVRKLNKQIGDLYSSYYTMNSHNQACWFDKARERHDKDLMLRLLGELNQRLQYIDDGSFVIDDRETGRVKAL